MNLRGKIVKLEASIPSVDKIVHDLERDETNRLLKRVGELLNLRELEALSGWACDQGMERHRLNGGKYPEQPPTPASRAAGIQWFRDLVETIEARYRREGREVPPPVWEDGIVGDGPRYRAASSPAVPCGVCGSAAGEADPVQDLAFVKSHTPDPCPVCGCRKSTRQGAIA